MAVKVAINGFGRIGRLVLRGIIESGRKDIQVIAINDLANVEENAHLLRYDSVHGRLPCKVTTTKNSLNAGRGAIKVFAERDPANLPWGKLGVDVALECTGLFTKREAAARHLQAGAKYVLVSAPAQNADLTVVYGVNHKKLRKSHKIVSNASCTTNCLAPVAQILHKQCGILRGYMTTVHAYTGDQQLLDVRHADPRRARAAAQSIIPTSTGAAKAIGLVLPELDGRLDGSAVRVPVPNVSMVDLVFEAARKTSVAAVNQSMEKAAARGPLKGVLAVVREPLTSVDFNHNAFSSNFDLTQTQLIGGKLVRVLSWYDNEWGFANRMSDVAVLMGK